MRVLICGSRDYDDRKTMLWFAGLFKNGDVLIEGGAKGADTLARLTVEALGYWVPVEEYPANWEKYGRAAGPIRNKQMLEEGKPDVVLAFPSKSLEESKGTRNMVEQAVKAGVPTYVVQRAG